MRSTTLATSQRTYLASVGLKLRFQYRYVKCWTGQDFNRIQHICFLKCKKRGVEALWLDFFSNTSQWFDHRPEKINPRFPDFKHKRTGEALWLADARDLTWVQAGLSAIPPGTLKSSAFAWTQRLKRYAKAGQYSKTIEVYLEMQQERICPDVSAFLPVLKACAGLGNVNEGKRVHTQIREAGCESDVYVATCLVDMYAKCGSIQDAWSVFNKMQDRDVVSWNAMIGGYVKSGQGPKAMELFKKMQPEGIKPDSVTFVGVLNACASIGALEEGKRVHEQIIQSKWDSDVYVANCLVDMYAKCGSSEGAWSVFNLMRERNVVSWNAMIGCYVKSGQGLKAMECFQEMQQEGVEPDDISFVAMLNACASVGALEEGRHVHNQIIHKGCGSHVYVATCLVDMYAKCGSIEDAWNVFEKMKQHTVVSWSAMIGGYVKSGQGLKAIRLYRKMEQEGIEPNTVTFVGVLNACASVEVLEEGRRIHEQIIQRGCESNVYVANCLVDMYAKCGSFTDAWNVFNKMQKHDVISWSAMIGGYVKSGQGLKAMELFRKMQHEGVQPNAVTFVGVLSACASVAALQEGRRAHEHIIQSGCWFDVYVANCLVDMYAKCGSIEDAERVFNMMLTRNVVSWTTMIGGYAMHGYAKKAMGLFKQMGKGGVETNGITFTCLLSACSHGGLVKEGLRYFKSMTSCFDILPTVEHFTCVVDLLGRAGRLMEAEEMTKRVPVKRDMWMSLLGACRIHGNMEMAERVAKRCWQLDPGDASGHVLLWNIYAASGKWDRSAPIGEQRLHGELWKEPGRTWTEVNNVVHSFDPHDKDHPQILEIYAELDKLSIQINEAGYIDTTFLLRRK